MHHTHCTPVERRLSATPVLACNTSEREHRSVAIAVVPPNRRWCGEWQRRSSCTAIAGVCARVRTVRGFPCLCSVAVLVVRTQWCNRAIVGAANKDRRCPCTRVSLEQATTRQTGNERQVSGRE